jgi:hypothetical protein
MTPTVTETPTNTPTNTVTPTITNTSTNTPTPTITETPTNTPTNTSSVTPTNTPTNTSTITPTPTITPTQTSLPVVNLLNNGQSIYVLNSYTCNLIFSTGNDSTTDIAIGNNNFYTLTYISDETTGYATGYTINQYNSTLSPLNISSELTTVGTFDWTTYSGLDYVYGMEVKDNNTLLIGGSSIYEYNLTTSGYTKVIDLSYPESVVIGDFIYNPYVDRIIVLAYGQLNTYFYISEYSLNGTLYAEYNITGDFSGDTPGALYVNNNNLYIVTQDNGLVYNYNLTNNTVSYVQTIIGNTNVSGMAAPNQNNNVSLIPNI